MLSDDSTEKIDDETSKSKKLQIRPQKIDTNLASDPPAKKKKKV